MKTTEKRRSTILRMISDQGFAKVVDLANNMNVTAVTIRTDLNILEQEGKIIRSHGGAVPTTSKVRDLKEDQKSGEHAIQKSSIAQAAARLVDENDSIIIASGSTMLAFAKAIDTSNPLNVVTPSLRIAMQFIDTPNVTTIQLGGTVYGNTLSTRGEYAEMGLSMFHCNKLFFGVEGFDPESGLTCATIEEATLTRKMIDSATKVIVLADSSKYCRRGFGKICNMDNIDTLITDSGLSEAARRRIEDCGVNIILV